MKNLQVQEEEHMLQRNEDIENILNYEISTPTQNELMCSSPKSPQHLMVTHMQALLRDSFHQFKIRKQVILE